MQNRHTIYSIREDMSVSTMIDTLRFSDRLRQSGFTPEQANALSLALSDELTEQLATKADVKALKVDIKALDTKFNYTMALIGLLVALRITPIVGKILG